MGIDGMDMDTEGFFFAATRTKPATTNKHAKRVGAKKAKRLELDDRFEYTLRAQDATIYRALAARCNYLAQDRPDLAFGVKKLCRESSVPNLNSFKKVKRLVRYLCGLPGIVYTYHFQDVPTTVDIFVDTDFVGRKETRRSTSGGLLWWEHA